jgi:16S rRNA processing protein RimM
VSNHNPSDCFIEVGVIGRPHGVRGELKVHLHCEGSAILYDKESLVVELCGRRRTVEIAGARSAANHVILTLCGIESREQADALKGAKILVPRHQLPEPEDDEFYVHDLLGMEVFEGAVHLGVVTSSRPQGDVEIATVRGEIEEFEVPLVDAFLVEMDFAGRRIELRDTEGLPRNPVRTGPRPSAAPT